MLTTKPHLLGFQDELHHSVPTSVCVALSTGLKLFLQFYILRDLGHLKLGRLTIDPAAQNDPLAVSVAITADCISSSSSEFLFTCD